MTPRTQGKAGRKSRARRSQESWQDRFSLPQRVLKFERELRILAYMLDDGFEPKLETLVQLFRDHAKLGWDAPVLPSVVAEHVAARVGKRTGRPKRQFTLDEYTALVVDEADMRSRVHKPDSGEVKKRRGDPTPYENELAELARRHGTNTKSMEKIRTQLTRGPFVRPKKPR